MEWAIRERDEALAEITCTTNRAGRAYHDGRFDLADDLIALLSTNTNTNTKCK